MISEYEKKRWFQNVIVLIIFSTVGYGCATGGAKIRRQPVVFSGQTAYDYRMPQPVLFNVGVSPVCYSTTDNNVLYDYNRPAHYQAKWDSEFVLGQKYSPIGRLTFNAKLDEARKIREIESRGADVAIFIDCYDYAPDQTIDQGSSTLTDLSTGKTYYTKMKSKGGYKEVWELYKCMDPGSCQPLTQQILNDNFEN